MKSIHPETMYILYYYVYVYEKHTFFYMEPENESLPERGKVCIFWNPHQFQVPAVCFQGCISVVNIELHL